MSSLSPHNCRPRNWWKRPELQPWFAQLMDSFSLSLVERIVKWVELAIQSTDLPSTRPFYFHLGIRAVPNFGDAKDTPALGTLMVIDMILPDKRWWTVANAEFVVSLKEGEIFPPMLKAEERIAFLQGAGAYFGLKMHFE